MLPPSPTKLVFLLKKVVELLSRDSNNQSDKAGESHPLPFFSLKIKNNKRIKNKITFFFLFVFFLRCEFNFCIVWRIFLKKCFQFQSSCWSINRGRNTHTQLKKKSFSVFFFSLLFKFKYLLSMMFEV